MNNLYSVLLKVLKNKFRGDTMQLVKGYSITNGFDIDLKKSYEYLKKYTHIVIKKNNRDTIKKISENKHLKDVYFIYIQSVKKCIPLHTLKKISDMETNSLSNKVYLKAGKYKGIPKV